MNWDISIGRTREAVGRTLQWLGARIARRQWVLDGEAMEYSGRLQTRYGLLKHQVQWGDDALRLKRQVIPVNDRRA